MGTVVSVHVVLAATPSGGLPPSGDAVIRSAIDAFVASLHADDATFSTYDERSEVRRIARGDLTLADASPCVREVEAACRAAREVTRGRFDAWWRGWFDPTGYVKGWAVERAYTEHLAPLLAHPGTVAVAANCGGDLRVGTAQHGTGTPADWVWRTGVVDPHDRSRLLATLELADGAVATSGSAERGAHIVVPGGAGRPAPAGGGASAVVSATVVSSRLDHADLWATSAVVAGFDDLTWIQDAGTRSGLVVADDGRTRRWAGAVEVVDVDDRQLGGDPLV